MKINLPLSIIFLCFLGASVIEAQPAKPLDLSKEKVLYEIGYSHLDTQWRWAYPQVISEFIPNTVHENIPLFEKYPDYIFNWTGANRYRFMKEYHPKDYEIVREWVAKGRWFPAGSSWEENDVNVPSSESLIRQVLFGHDFFKKEFGTESCEYMIPDCFGFPASLPSVLAHCGLRGFSTQKLTWGSAIGIPFNVGVWEGLDGQSVIAALNPGSYGSEIKENLSLSTNWNERLENDGKKSGVFADYAYFGVGDRGGAPTEGSVKWLEKSIHSDGPVRVVSARADQMFRDITDAEKAKLPVYKGDILLTQHSAGSISSEAYMKRWNRKNELLADAAERASVAAYVLGAAPYPREKLHHAWELVLGGQFHDMLPGTALPKAFEFAWNDEIIAMNCFAEALQDGVGGVARALDTRVNGVPLVVYNPLSIAREDVAEADVKLPGGTSSVQVFDGDGKLVPTQLVSNEDGKCHFLFLAKVPSIGFAVYSVKGEGGGEPTDALKVTNRSLENQRYRVTLNDAGDIASVYDKVAQKELLSAPARLAFLTENPKEWPAWNMDWSDQSTAPRGYVDGAATFRIVENGPVRVAIEVTRQAENSVFVQTIRLAAGEAGDRVEIKNHIDWQSRACALKATFPLTVSNPEATYNWDVGKIERGNDDPKKYEVPSHQWFDLTDSDGSYGVSILNDTKYGSDKPSDDLLRLTLVYTPGVKNAHDYQEQQYQDWGRHDFIYGIYGHEGDWRKGGSDWQSARLGQPLLVFRTAAHAGKLGRSFSLLRLNSDDVAVRAVKMAEDRDQVVVRLQELNGAGTKTMELTGPNGIDHVSELNGVEDKLGEVPSQGGSLALDFKPYQLRTLGLNLGAPAKLTPPISVPVKLPYNLDIFSFNDSKYDGGCDDQGATIPAEMINDTVISEGIKFQIGPTDNGKQNAVLCQGQTIALPHGKFNRIYLLAMAVNGDTEGAFKVDGRETQLPIQDWSGYIGQWDNRIFRGDIPELTYSVNNPLDRLDAGFIKRAPLAWFCSHRHQQDGSDQVYTYCYLFKYHLDVPAGAKTLTLPDNGRIRVVAVSVARDGNDATVATLPLYDDFTGRTALDLKERSNSK
jgi:alpha-mannosidase